MHNGPKFTLANVQWVITATRRLFDCDFAMCIHSGECSIYSAQLQCYTPIYWYGGRTKAGIEKKPNNGP